MKKLFLAVPICATLAGCSYGMPTQDIALRDHLRNPLYAEYYYDDLAEQMINLSINDHPLAKDASNRAIIDRTRTRALEHASIALDAQAKGRVGSFVSDDGLVVGEALLLDGILYIGPSFDAAPGPAQRLYLTTVVDPRDGEFPDPTAVAVGGLKNQYGAQTYDVSLLTPSSGTGTLRTAVLWDDDLGRLYGFAQLAQIAR